MEFRDLKRQYKKLKPEIDAVIKKVMENADFISGNEVKELEQQLAEYVGVKHCITCGNGTDALQLALLAWGIGPGDAVFVPDFTFFASAEVIAAVGATPVFVDVLEDTFNISPESLEDAVRNIVEGKKQVPKAVVAVDLFGLPADYPRIRKICKKYNLLLLEDGAQGFGGTINGQRACSFGDISTTSFFPAKPLGCYGDGGAIFTNSDEWAELLQSLVVHGKCGNNKYDNVRIGMNSRLDTIQAAILRIKLNAFQREELSIVNLIAKQYNDELKYSDLILPFIKEGFTSSWAQYTVKLPERVNRSVMQDELKKYGIPTMVYYNKPMHLQKAFSGIVNISMDCPIASSLCGKVISLPIHPYMSREEQLLVIEKLKYLLGKTW